MIIHPLESLSASEIATAVKLFREYHADEQAFFSSIGLTEPNKLDVLNETNILQSRYLDRRRSEV